MGIGTALFILGILALMSWNEGFRKAAVMLMAAVVVLLLITAISIVHRQETGYREREIAAPSEAKEPSPVPAPVAQPLVAKPAPKAKPDLAKDKPGFSLQYIPDGANRGVWACRAGGDTWMIARVLAVENRERVMTESGARVNDYLSFGEAYNAARDYTRDFCATRPPSAWGLDPPPKPAPNPNAVFEEDAAEFWKRRGSTIITAFRISTRHNYVGYTTAKRWYPAALPTSPPYDKPGWIIEEAYGCLEGGRFRPIIIARHGIWPASLVDVNESRKDVEMKTAAEAEAAADDYAVAHCPH
jgi:hypothetical protein